MTDKEKSLAITMLRPKYKLKNLLTRFDMSKSSHWYAMSQASHPDRHGGERAPVHSVFEGSGRTCGCGRIWMSLRRDAGLVISEKVVGRLMKEEGAVVKRRRRREYSSSMGTIGVIPENVLDRDFSSALPNTKWVTDITEFLVGEGRVYLSAMVDLLNGGAVSYSASLHPNTGLVMATVDDALVRLSADEHPVIHSDRGHHYQRDAYVRTLSERGIIQSMSRKGCSPDNAACEGFWGHLKNEFFYNNDFEGVSPENFMVRLAGWIDWYNTGRIKMVLGGMTPVEYRHAYEVRCVA